MANVDYISKWQNCSLNKYKGADVLPLYEIKIVFNKLKAAEGEEILFWRSEYQKSLDVCLQEIRNLKLKIKKTKNIEEKTYYKERIDNPYMINVREYKMKIFMCNAAIKTIKLKGCKKKNSQGLNCGRSNLVFVDYCIYHRP